MRLLKTCKKVSASFNFKFFNMKKISVFMSAMAFFFAIATAFAFKPADTIVHGYKVGNECRQTIVECDGDSQACQLDVPEDGIAAPVAVGDFNSGCAQLRMP